MFNEIGQVDYFIVILKELHRNKEMTRTELVKGILARDPSFAVTDIQRAVNCLLESKIIRSSFGKLTIRKRYAKEVDIIIQPDSNKVLTHGYLEDLYNREQEISRAAPTKWVEFFLGLVSVLQIVPFVGELVGANGTSLIAVIVILGALCWLLIFNGTYFNKHPILIPLDIQQELSFQYNAEDYVKHSAPQIERGKHLIALANLQDNDVVVDVGCGDGRTTLALFDTNPNVKSITGYDISSSQVHKANQLASEEGNEAFRRAVIFECLDFSQADHIDTPHFTLAFSNVVIHWIGPQAYKRMFDLLVPGGRICVEQCGYDDLQELHDVCSKVTTDMGMGELFKDWRIQDHGYYIPKQEELHRTLTDIGYENINIQHEAFDYPQDHSPEGIFEAFLVSSLHRYYDVIKDEGLCVQFKEQVRERFKTEGTPAHAHRLIVTATKPL